MALTSRGRSVRAGVAIGCVLLGLVSLGLWWVMYGTQALPYSDGASPSSTAQVAAGETYSLAVPGGVSVLRARGVPVTPTTNTLALDCTWSVGNSDRQVLTVTSERLDTKAVNTFAHFEAPVSGRLHITCAQWGTVFVPDSEDRVTDISLLYLVLSAVLLSVGLPLGTAAIRAALADRRDRASFGWDGRDEPFEEDHGYLDALGGYEAEDGR